MKPKARIFSLWLAVCLVWTLLPTVAYAEEPAQDSGAIVLGTDGISSPTEVVDQADNTKKHYTPNSYVYFGVNGSAPIKWRVLDAENANDETTDGLFLLSEDLLDSNVKFNGESDKGNAWQGSGAQAWCSSFAKNTNNFSSAEQTAMLGVAKSDASETSLYSIPWGASSLTAAEKMFFLSVRELADYVGNYDGAPGLVATDTAQSAGVWWLRSPNAYYDTYAGVVSHDGYVSDDLVGSDWSARPAFNLNLESVLFTSAAAGGKSSGAVGDGALQKISADSPTEWKLTLLDSTRNFKADIAGATSGTAAPGRNIFITYFGAQTGENEYVSAILADSAGKPLYYGRIAQGSTESGTAEVTIPEGLAEGSYTLKVFSEQCNGDYKTDYASDFVDLSITVGSAAVENKLISITQPDPVSGLANGITKAELANMLPAKVAIITSDGTQTAADVTWNIDSCAYKQNDEAAQTFTVNGTVTLPDGVTRPDNVSATVSISVSVSAKPDPTVSGITVKTQPDKTAYTAGETLDLTGLEVTIGYSGGDPKDMRYPDFLDSGVSTEPLHGAPLNESNKQVTVTIGTSSASFLITVTPKDESGEGDGGTTGPDNPGGGSDPDPDNPGGEDKPNRPSGSDDDDGYDHDDENYDFWQDVKGQIQKAKSGDIIRINAKSYDELSFTVMEALYQNSGVSLEIRWNGGETFTIPAGKALAPEKGRIFYRLDYLAQLYGGAQPPAVLPEDKKYLLYVVKPGDTLWALSQQCGCSVEEIVALNGELIKDPHWIYVGWELKLPQK